MLKSTSFHRISAEDRHSRYTKPLYYFFYYCFNKLNNTVGANIIDKNVRVVNYETVITKAEWQEFHVKSSPARKLTDIFLKKLAWEKINRNLKSINVLDVGCGAGNYAEKLIDWSGNRINTYLGVDLHTHDNWNLLKQKYHQVNFIKGNAINIQKYINSETNFIISLSAIEHIKEDLTFFRNLSNCLRTRKKPTLQVHLLPAPACLDLYGFHGVRQYNLRTISQITKLFQQFSSSVLYKLGGAACNALHWSHITKPLIMKTLKLSPVGDRRESETKDYNRKLWQAIQVDMKTDGSSPTFYALIIQSYVKDSSLTLIN